MKNWIRNSFLLTLLFIVSIGRTQNYPVQTFVQLTPPYSSYLPDYSDPFNNQLKVLLTLTDFSVPSYQVKLRFKIEGQGYTIQSTDIINLPAINLSPGVPVEISGSALAPYLATNNLSFSGIDVANYEQTKILPEGPASICVEIVDIASGAILGNEACAQSWFYKHQAPLLNLPICGSEVTPTTPQNIMFQWTPMHMSIGMNITYQFELFKSYPENEDPNVVVGNSFLKIADITTSNTFLLYDLTNTPLEIGEEYVWRIKASDITGRDLFNNNGYSQVCTFTYGNVAGSLLNGYAIQLTSVGTSKRQGKATWNTSGIIDEYLLEVRKTGNPNYSWFPYNTTVGELKVNNLEPETEYECRVKGKLGQAETDWSNTTTFTTLAAQEYACNSEAMPGLPPVFNPALELLTGDIVQVGQFEMTVSSAVPSGAPGFFDGDGFIFIPFMLMPVAVEFDHIKIDENLTMQDGRVNAITKGVDAWVNESVTHTIPGTVDSVASNPQDSVVVFYFGNDSQSFDWPTPGNTVTVTDENNKEYVIDEHGNVTEGYITEYDNEDLDATATYQVIFNEATTDQFGFDQKEYDPWTLYYPCILLSDSSKYFTSHKAIHDGLSDQVNAVLVSDQPPTTLTFKDEDNNTYPATANGDTYTIDLNTNNDPSSLYAFDANGLKLGKLNLVVYDQKDLDVVLVPVNGATATNDANLTSYLNNTFTGANLNFTVSTDSNFQSTFDTDGNGLQSPSDEEMSNYSAEMKALRDEYFAAKPNANKDALYLFVIPNFDDPTADGYMVRGKSMGFIKSGASDRTYAHELGHGFKLKHTFPANSTGSTTNLMDYSTGDDLAAFQWKTIRDFSFAFSFLDDAEDGGAIVINASNSNPILDLSNSDSSITFFSLAGEPITLKGQISKLTFVTFEDKWTLNGQIVTNSYAPVGALSHFTLNGHEYTAKGASNNGDFLGYYCSGISEWYIDSVSNNVNYEPVLVLPSYTVTGFKGQAFKSSVNQSNFILSDTNKASGTTLSTWDLMAHIDPSKIDQGVDLTIQLSNPVSLDTRSILESILFSNVAGSNSTQPNSNTVNYTHLMENSLYVDEVVQAHQSLLGVNITTEKYIGYHALVIYSMAQYIDNSQAAAGCFSDMAQMISDQVSYDMAIAHSNKLKGNTTYQLDLNENYDLYVQSNYAPADQTLISLPQHDAIFDQVYLPTSANEYKATRLSLLFEEIRLYNSINESLAAQAELSESEIELLLGNVFAANKSHISNAGDCALKLLSPANKKKIIELFITKNGTTGSVVSDELLVLVLENTTPEQFEMMYPALLTSDCTLFEDLNDNLSDVHLDRFVNRLSLLVMELQKGQASYNSSSIPKIPLMKDDLNPFDHSLQSTVTGCNVLFSSDYWGGLSTGNYNAHQLWDIIEFDIEDNFDVPGLNGESLGPNNYIRAPAYWAHYFLERQDDITDETVLRYTITALSIFVTGGTSTPALLALTSLGASYGLRIYSDGLSQQDMQVYQALSVAFEAMANLVMFTNTSYMAQSGLTKIPFLTRTVQTGSKFFSFAFNEVGSLMRLIKVNPTFSHAFAGSVDDLVLQLGALTPAQFIGPKVAFLDALIKVGHEARLAAYTPSVLNGYLSVSNGQLTLQMTKAFGLLNGTEQLVLGDFGITAQNTIYIENVVAGPANGNVITPVNDIQLMENGVLSSKSYNVVVDANGAFGLVEVGANNLSWVDGLTGNGWTQLLRDALKNDLTNHPNIFDNLNNVAGANAWKSIRESIGNTTNGGFTQFAVDPESLSKVSQMMQSGSVWRNAMGSNWENELAVIIEKNSALRCATCNSGFAYRSDFVKFLGEVEFYVSNYNINGIGNKFYRWIKRQNVDGSIMNETTNLGNLDEMYHTLSYLKANNISNVIDFGSTFPQGSKQYDLFFGQGVYVELKNANFTNGSLPLQVQDQLIGGYFKNINSLDDFEWIASFEKLKVNGWTNKLTAESNMKNLWKDVFVNRANDMFNTLGVDQMKLLFNDQALNNPSIFVNKLNNNQAFLNNALKFIKVE